jgi:hypothetical protein
MNRKNHRVWHHEYRTKIIKRETIVNNQIIFVDSSVQDYQSLIKDIDRAKIVI